MKIGPLSLYRYLIFDLDGTLTDPRLGILRCINHALKENAIPELDESKDYSSLVGPPLRDDFRVLLGRNAEDSLIEKLVASYRKRYETSGIFENFLYPGIRDLIKDLLSNSTANQRKLIVATTKPLIFAERIIEHFKLSDSFDYIIGSELDGRRSYKEDLIKCVIDHYADYDLRSYLMIGDRMHDVEGAKRVGIDSVGVLYGYGTESEIRDSNPTFIVRTVRELNELLKDN